MILVNNISTSLAEQPSPKSLPPGVPSFSEQAEIWANRAIATADAMPKGKRNKECIFAVATAKSNIAHLAERTGDFERAAGLFAESEALSKKIGYEEGKVVAIKGRRRTQGAIVNQES
jgi:hypothetical protein